jgi:hypothetical protein
MTNTQLNRPIERAPRAALTRCRLHARPLLASAALLASAVTAFADLGDDASTDGLVRTAPGRMYFTENGRILEINTQHQRVEPISENIAARALLVDDENRLHAASLRYDPKTDLYRPHVWQLGVDQSAGGRTPASATSFAFSEVADSAGNLYFWQVDAARKLSRILIKRKNAEPEVFAGHRWGVADGLGAQAKISQVGSMTIGPDGCLYFTDHQCVRKVDARGRVTTVASGGLLGLGSGRERGNHLTAIAVDDAGTCFVADRATQRIFEVRPNGEVTTLTYNTDQWIPAGVAWSSGGLYVLERHAKESRIIRVGPNGQRETLPRAGTTAGSRETPPIWLSERRSPPHRPESASAFLVPEIAIGFE